jgi:outer membrane protein TolC
MSFQSLRRPKLGVLLVLSALIPFAAGCYQRKDASELHYVGHEGPDYYKDIATSIEYSSTQQERPEVVTASVEPHTIAEPRKDQIWDLTLGQALQLALSNNKVIRSAAAFTTPGNGLMSNPNNQPSVYDSALQETGVLLGQRGVEAALSDFDATLTTTFNVGQNEAVQNNAALAGGLAAGQVLDQYSGTYNTTLAKTFANGGTLSVNNAWNYVATNQPVLFPTSYNGSVQAQYTQPLWAGSGTEFTRIATPLGSTVSGVSGVSQGVVISRINEDIALGAFELSALTLLRDTENTYWNLYLQYRLYHTAVVAHNSALRSWREAYAKLNAGGVTGFSPVDEAQALDQLYNTRATAEQTLSNLYTNETDLRRLLGLPVNDGRIIRPVDEPSTAKFIPDWYNCLTEALTRRVELRTQKWNIKSYELQLKAARSLTNPVLNFTGSYRVNAFGNDLISQQSMLTQPYSSAFASLAEAQETGWNAGFTLFVPIGFRSARAQVRNYEWRVEKARVGLAEQEMEVAQELAVAFQNVAADYQTAQSYFNRRIATERELALYQYQYEAGTTTLAFVLTAQSSLASAEQSYYTSLATYAQAIMDLNFRKGTLLDYHNVSLAESEWTPGAYRDAVRDAWARAHAIPANFLKTKPEEFELPYATPGTGAPIEVSPGPAATQTVPPAPAAAPATAPATAPPPAPPATPPAGTPSGPPMAPAETPMQSFQPRPEAPGGPQLTPAPPAQ